MATNEAPKRPPFLIRVLHTVVRAVLLAFAVGFGLGTWLRCTADPGPPRALPYLGERTTEVESDRPA
jgi:hypothetical protein